MIQLQYKLTFRKYIFTEVVAPNVTVGLVSTPTADKWATKEVNKLGNILVAEYFNYQTANEFNILHNVISKSERTK